ncbi:unnamed protein product [Cylicocyclus nassatus]|uniref:Uncharacterized protein n=1 Tax=Cylicocyclus nassatus TaxID=53992 RepID=A0AA36H8R1_CYLNA|nr:unnamed protein product [Cylicocyclus nassatus]
MIQLAHLHCSGSRRNAAVRLNALFASLKVLTSVTGFLMEKGRSPSWKNPRERLKKHLRRTSSARSLVGPHASAVKNLDFDDVPHEVLPSPSSRRNPFKRSPLKKRRKLAEENCATVNVPIVWDDTNANDPFSNEKLLHIHSASSSRTIENGFFKESFATDFSDIFLNEASTSRPKEEAQCCKSIPLDLRLGTKLRITSKKPFPWIRDPKSSGVVSVRVTGQERHDGLRCFMNSVANEFASPSNVDIPSNISAMAVLESACLSWQFPCFPWLPTYPRADSLTNTSSAVMQEPLPKQCLDALDMQWTECFDQLFLSWKKGDRKSFYMSCSSFTVLFTKVNYGDEITATEDSSSCFQTCGGLRHVAIVTPSTIGFRQYLRSEGIEYEVISKKTKRNSKTFTSLLASDDSKSTFDFSGMTESQPPLFSYETSTKADSSFNENKENKLNTGISSSDESPNKADISGDHDWLEEIDISPKKASKLKRYKSLGSMANLSNDASFAKPDVIDAVAVLVKGSDVQTLYNLLQSSRVCRSIAGPHANIPPTLISSSPFLYSQLQTLKKSSQIIRRKQYEYVLELDGGPIMPHTIPLIVEFLRRSEVCSDEPATLRINDRAVCNGLNDIDSEYCDWNEIRVDKENIWWTKL